MKTGEIIFSDPAQNHALVVHVREPDNMVVMAVGCGDQGVMEYPLDPLTLQVLVDALMSADRVRTERAL